MEVNNVIYYGSYTLYSGFDTYKAINKIIFYIIV